MSINFLDPVTNYGTVQSRVNANFAALKAYTDEKVGSIRDELTVVNGGAVNLDDSLPVGSLLGYKVTATTTIEGFEFGPGDYVFTRTADGWEYRALAPATPIGAVPDDTPPIGGTLSTSNVTGSSFRMTVTGASDPDSGLHPSPYRFSTNAGVSWSAWQSSNVYDATGLAPETTYQPRAQVRNNAAPTSLSTTIAAADVTTLADPTIPISRETFTRPDGTLMDGIFTEVGGHAIIWSTNWISGLDAAKAAKVTGNRVVGEALGGQGGAAGEIWAPARGNVKVGMDYDVTGGSHANRQVQLKLRGGPNAIVCIKHNGEVRYGSSSGSIIATGVATAGTLTIEYSGNDVIVAIDGVTIHTVDNGEPALGQGWAFAVYEAGVWVDDLRAWSL